MAIASVVQGLIETEGGKVFDLDSCKGSTWVESVNSFKYVPTGASNPYTVRKEAKKGGDYWYGYRKVAGKLHKKYIGKSSELSTTKLEEIAKALNTPQQARVTQVTDTVTQVTEVNSQQVTDTVTDRDTAERLTALELQFQALQESLEELRAVLLGKSERLGNSSELLNPDKVTDKELQNELSSLSSELQDENQRLLIELGNLTAENQKVRADYAVLLESSTHVTNKLRQEVQELRSQLETERVDRGEIEAELSELKQKSATAGKDLPEAADLLNQLKTRRKKSKSDLTDLEVILEILEE
jgi:chromosome segregation ATPase